MVNFIFEKIDLADSTNDQITREVESGIILKDKILIARHQSNGHGTNGRSFISDSDTGLYFTYLHFYNDEKELKFLTQKVAVAVYEVFKQIFDIEFAIKWVNDLYYKNKKICGILCRNLIKHRAVIIGVGIDLFKNDNLSVSIKDIAGYIFEDKKDLIAHLNNNKLLSKDSCMYKNIYDDFKSLDLDDIEINDKNLWQPDALTIQIVMEINSLIAKDGMPQLYIEKNIIKDERIYEDYNLEC